MDISSWHIYNPGADPSLMMDRLKGTWHAPGLLESRRSDTNGPHKNVPFAPKPSGSQHGPHTVLHYFSQSTSSSIFGVLSQASILSVIGFMILHFSL